LVPWTNFTGAENLGLGSIFYPVLGLAALLFTVAAAITFRFDRDARRSGRFPLYSAAVLAVAWAAITRFVLVPAMSHVSAAANNAAELQQLFMTVTQWSGVNDALHVLTFGLSLWWLAELFSSRKTNE
jgi:cytochrome c biogenesis factor